MEKATFAAGCFWHVQAEFDKLPIKTEVGFMGGKKLDLAHPYKQVCYGKTGNAEVIQITFDPKKVSYKKLLEIFFQVHDPTQLNRQGPDVGDQYRSEVFYHNQEQKTLSEKAIKSLQPSFKNKIVTKLSKAGTFYPAEEYHQKYLKKKGLASCSI